MDSVWCTDVDVLMYGCIMYGCIMYRCMYDVCMMYDVGGLTVWWGIRQTKAFFLPLVYCLVSKQYEYFEDARPQVGKF